MADSGIRDEGGPSRESESEAALDRILSVSLQAIGLDAKFEAILDILFNISWLRIEHKGSVFLANPDGDRLDMVANRFLSDDLRSACAQVPIGHCLCGRAAERGELVFSSHLDQEHETRTGDISDHGHYCQPVLANGQLLGVLNLYLAPGHVSSPEERIFLQSVADCMAGIIEREQMEEERQRLITVVEESPDFICITDTRDRPLYFNRSVRELLGCQDSTDIDACRIDDLFVDQSARLVREEGIPAAISHGIWKGETYIRHADGDAQPVSQVILAPRDAHRQPRFLATVCHDLSDRKKVEKTLRALAMHEQHFANAIINSLPGIFFTLTDTGYIARWNRNMERNLGYSAEQLERMTLHDLMGEADTARIQQAIDQADEGRTVTVEVELRTVSGIGVSYLVSTSVISTDLGGGISVIGVGFDLSERKALEKELERQASVDFLTGAYNRRKFTKFLEFECAKAERYGRSFSLIMFDIDHFKPINDEYGHDVGDRVLCEMVRRAQGCLRRSDIFARWGGEEFVVLAPESVADQAALLAEKMRCNLRDAPIDIVGTVTASFGVAEFRPTETVEDLAKRVDDTLYLAKKRGRDCVVVDKVQPVSAN